MNRSVTPDRLLDAPHLSLREHIGEIGRTHLEPIAREADESPTLRWDVVRILADAGVFKLVVPPEYGGEGISLRAVCVARERLANVSAHADTMFAMQGLGSYPISAFGNRDQRATYLPGVAKGSLIAAFAVTEPGAGSDVAALSTSATLRGDDYVLNGEKRLISNAGDAHFYVLFAKTRPQEGRNGISAFILPADHAGLEIRRPTHLLGEHVIGELTLQDVRLAAPALIGAEGQGFMIAMQTLDVFRASVGAAAVGMAQRALDEALAYTSQRVQFGRPLADLEIVQYKLADMATELAAARLLVYKAAALFDDGAERTTLESSMAKLFATEAAQRIIDQSLQLHGGVGLVRGNVVERLYREVRALRIYEGTSEIQHLVIARQLLRRFKGQAPS